MPRATVKRLAESLLEASGIGGIATWSHRRRTVVLAYHNVMPARETPRGDPGLHLPQTVFADHLDSLLETHDVISITAIDNPPSGERPRAVITFDDAYHGALTSGVEELHRRALPATVFVAPGLFGAATWWDRLSESSAGGLSPSIRDEALSTHQGRSDLIAKALGGGAQSLPVWARIAEEEDVRAAVGRSGITLGAHTWNHPNLAALDPPALTSELERPLAWLRGFGAAAVPWLAYPYGLSSTAVAQAAAATGYVGAFRNDGGWLPGDAAQRTLRFDLPRLNVPSSLTLSAFRLRAAGLLGP